MRTVLNADLVVLNTAVAGKWIDTTLKADASKVLSKTLWWIHEMRGHYFVPEYVRHLPNVAGVMIDSNATAEYWQNRTKERLRLALELVLQYKHEKLSIICLLWPFPLWCLSEMHYF